MIFWDISRTLLIRLQAKKRIINNRRRKKKVKIMTAKMKNQKKNKKNKKVKKPMIIRIMISNHYGNRRFNNLIKLKRMINQKKKKNLNLLKIMLWIKYHLYFNLQF